MRRFDFRTAYVFVCCLTIAGVSADLLYQDIHFSAGEGMGTPMARIERSDAKVRRKRAKSFAWNAAHADEALYRRDSVQTGEGSGALIRFNDQTLVELGENSLVVIEEGEKLSLDYVKGSVVVHTAQGDVHVVVGDNGKAKLEELPIRLVEPAPLARYYSDPQKGGAVHFAWKARTGGQQITDKMTLEISRTRSFRSGDMKRMEVTSEELSVPLVEGKYFWRLSSQGKPVTEVSQFRVTAARPLRLLSPTPADRIATFGELVSAQFKWAVPTDGAAPAESEIQVADDPTFVSIVVHQKIDAEVGVATLHGLPPAKLWWRVTSRFGDIDVLSPAQPFSIEKEQRPSLALTFPEANRKIENLPNLRFNWHSDTDGLEYVLEVKGLQEKAILSERLNNNGFVWKVPLPGNFLWRVSAIEQGQKVAETDWRALSVLEGKPIALQTPEKSREIYFWKKATTFDYSWKADELLTRKPGYAYLVQVASDADFKSVQKSFRTRETQVADEKLPLTGGQYFWRVQVVDENGDAIKTSDPWKFVYGNFPELGAPSALLPIRNQVYRLIEGEQAPVVSWTPVKDAEEYELTIYKKSDGRMTASDGSAVLSKQTTEKTSIELKGLPSGSYFWSVRAVDPIKRRGKSMTPSTFSIVEGDVLSAPDDTSDQVQ